MGFYFHGFRYPETNGTPPLVDRANTREVEEPFRKGRGLVVRFARLRALVIGRWSERSTRKDEDEALVEAVEGKVLPYTVDEISDW